MADRFFLDPLGPVNAYGFGDRDEFQHNNSGIFKVYSPVVIPFLMQGKIGFLNSTWPKIKNITKNEYMFEHALNCLKEGKEIKEILNNYVEKSLNSPEYFKESLESARNTSFNDDKDLADIFSREQLPEDNKEKLGKLVGRLCAGFCAAAPFYDLEAIVDNDDTRGKRFIWNPVVSAGEEIEKIASNVKKRIQTSKSGKNPDSIYKIVEGLRVEQADMEILDKYEGLGILPGLFNDHMKNYSISSWEDVRGLLKKIRNEDEVAYRTLGRISKQVNRPEEDAAFAGYLLTSNCKNRLTRDEAIEMIKRTEQVSKESKAELPGAIDSLLGSYLTPGEFIKLKKLTKILRTAEETNSLIRFQNWLPLIKCEGNIKGKSLSYASICDTSSQIFGLLEENPGLFRKREDYRRFIDDFENIKNIDASSAKGRWFLRFIESTDSMIKDGIMKTAEKEKERYLKMLLR